MVIKLCCHREFLHVSTTKRHCYQFPSENFWVLEELWESFPHGRFSKLVLKNRAQFIGVGFSSFRSVTVFKKTLKQTWTSKVFLFFYYILLTFILVSCCASFFYVNHALACSKLIKILFCNFPQTVKFLLSVLTCLKG